MIIQFKILIFASFFNPKIFNKMSDIAEKVKSIIVEKLGVEASEVTPEVIPLY